MSLLSKVLRDERRWGGPEQERRDTVARFDLKLNRTAASIRSVNRAWSELVSYRGRGG